jgi:sugar (pentulose or hexulose) kinase
MSDDVAPLTLGIDLGTSAVKVELLSADGLPLATGEGDHPTFGHEGAAEQRPGDWDDALAVALSELAAQARERVRKWRERVAAIGVAGQLPTLVCLADDKVIGTAITWKDARADAWAGVAIGTDERRDLYQRTGMPIDGRYLGPMHRFHRSDTRTRTVLSAKDYLVWRLTGRRVTDPSTAAGYATFDLDSNAFAADLCDRWGLSLAQMPALAAAASAAGTVTPAAAARFGLPQGIPVAVGAADSVAGGYAMTGLSSGRVSVAMGSSTIILATTNVPARDAHARCLVTPHVEPGHYALEMDLIATGTGYAWLSGLLGYGPGELDVAAGRSEPGARGLVFEPYVGGGEQGALWDPSLRGAVTGLSLSHGRDDIARAYLEGVAFEIRRCLDVIAERQPVREVVFSGHAAASAMTLRFYADALGVAVRPCALRSSAAVGAALSARALAGLRPLEHGVEVMASVEPGSAAAHYGRLYAAYRARR